MLFNYIHNENIHNTVLMLDINGQDNETLSLFGYIIYTLGLLEYIMGIIFLFVFMIKTRKSKFIILLCIYNLTLQIML